MSQQLFFFGLGMVVSAVLLNTTAPENNGKFIVAVVAIGAIVLSLFL